jgi:hypothetical protein
LASARARQDHLGEGFAALDLRAAHLQQLWTANQQPAPDRPPFADQARAAG